MLFEVPDGRRQSARRPRQLPLRFERRAAAGTRARWRRRCCASRGAPLRLTLTENRSVLLSFRAASDGIVAAAPAPHVPARAPGAWCAAVARGLRRTSRSADGEVRRFMNENLHRVRRVPRQPAAAPHRGRVYDLQQVFDRLNAALLRRRRCGAAHLGPRQRPRAPRRAHLRQLRPRAGAHPHPSRARPPRRAALLPGERRLPRDAAPPPGRRRPTAPGRTVYHSRAFREAEARYPWHRAGAGLGEGEPSAPAARQPGARPAAPQPSRRAPARTRLERARP